MALLALPLAVSIATAVPTTPASPSTPAPRTAPMPPGTLDSLATSLRGVLINDLPTPLLVDDKNWGHQRYIANGVKWKGQGLGVHAEVMKAPKNDGIWTRITLTAPNRNAMVFQLSNLQQQPSGPTTFDAYLSFECNAEYERQNWKAGVRVYSGSTRLRFRIHIRLKCEVTSRLERTGGALPDFVFRIRVAHADVTYDNMVWEHVLGLGGEAAKLIGDAIRGGVHRFRPNVETEMLGKANASIVKAADTREVRVHLSLMVPR